MPPTKEESAPPPPATKRQRTEKPIIPLNNVARTLASLHVPGSPLLLTNVWDPISARMVLDNKKTKAIATASYAVAQSVGLDDDSMSLESGLDPALEAVKRITSQLGGSSIPLSVDAQEGYGTRLQEMVERLIDLGVVGINLEDLHAGASVKGA